MDEIAKMHWHRQLLILSLVTALIPASLWAQTTISLDAGGSNVKYTDGPQTTSALLSPFFSAYNQQASLTAVGNYSRFSTGGSSLQGTVNLSALSSATAAFRLEGAGTFSGSTFSAGSSSHFASAKARAHLISSNRGASIGGGVGRSSDGEFNHDLILGEVAGWVQSGPTLFQIVATPTRLRDEVDYTDLEATVSRFGARTDVYASAGARMLSGGNSSWASAGITYRVLSWLGVVASAGNYAPDYTQGIPGGRYISAALRFSPRTSRDASSGVGSEPVDAPRTMSERDTDRTDRTGRIYALSTGAPVGTGQLREVKVRASGASSVELTGDFTSWEPLPMRSTGDGWWVATVRLPAGIYHMNVRTNGGDWTVPDGMTVISDEFGGSVGILVIE